MAIDHLSALPDDLLRHILYFTAAKEAVSTSALSRRWRSLWRSSGAVNLDTRSYFNFRTRDAFFHDADRVLGRLATVGPIRKLTFYVQMRERDPHATRWFLSHPGSGERFNFVEHVVSHPTARRIEELSVVVAEGHGDMCAIDDEDGKCSRGFYDLSIGSLPSETLRVLHVVNCTRLTSPEQAVAFPRLAELRLRCCTVSVADLQRVFDAAPHLNTVRLVYVSLILDNSETVVRLRFPAATAVVLSRSNHCAMELDAPKLRQFRYKGIVTPFAMNSQAPDLGRVDLHFLRDHERTDETIPKKFWQFLRSFGDAKVLTLTMHNYRLNDIAVVDEERQSEFLGFFLGRVERLELQGPYNPGCGTAGVAIANLLHCCPVLRDLKLRLTTATNKSMNASENRSEFLRRKDESGFSKCVDHFNRRRLKSAVFVDDEDDDVSDVPGLSGNSFECLQSNLKRLSLQFRLEEEKSNSFGVQLAKFFTENAMVLEEMYVDDGNKNMRKHINSTIERWVASSLERRDSSCATGLVVLPLERF